MMHFRPAHLGAVGLLVLTLAASGCARGDTGDDSVATAGSRAPAAASNGTADGDWLRFAKCMREQGIEMADPQTGNGQTRIQIKEGGDPAKAAAAQKACQQYAPKGVTAGDRPDPQKEETFRKHAQCMREHGVADFPDPRAGGGATAGGPGNFAEDPDFPAAQKFCDKEFLPNLREERNGG